LRPHGPTLKALIGIGAPSFLAGFGATLLAVLVNTTLAHGSGVVALAAFALCARIQTFVLMPQLGISQGLQPIVGFNAGRGLAERVLRARNLSIGATAVYGVIVAALVTVFADALVGAFVGDSPAVAATAVQALRVIALGFTVAGIAPLVSAYCQALGRPGPSYLISVGTLLGLKIDDKDVGHAPFQRCHTFACYAQVVVDDPLVEQLKTGKTAIFIIFQTEEAGIGIPISLAGFKEALEELK